MQRIYLPHTPFLEILEITQKELYHQLTRVLRARIDQEVIFFDGVSPEDHLYIMVHINKNTVSFRKQEIIQKTSELFPTLELFQALPNKLEKIESIVQKCCEIGYKKIVFFVSQRSQKLIISESKKQRFEKIAIEAIEQCGGNSIPEILFFGDDFSFEKDMIQEKTTIKTLSLFCHTSGKSAKKLSDISFEKRDIIQVFVGPEGGFSENEAKAFETNSLQQVYFGNRILRCETVGEVVGFYLSQKKEA